MPTPGKICLTFIFFILFKPTYPQIDSAVRRAISTKIAGRQYSAVLDTDGSIRIDKDGHHFVQQIKNSVLEGEGIYDIKFIDVDGDGCKDVVVLHNSNVDDRRDLFLFDKRQGRFRQVKNFSDYPEPIEIEGTHLYYSYHRSGCADYDWDSDLFKIVNFKIVKVGNISGQGCDDDESHGIFIYKTVNGSAKLVKKFPMSKVGNYANGKWGFIADYWKHNYKEFVSEFNRLPASRAFAGSDN